MIKRSGFSILELTITIAIISCMTAMLWGSFNKFKEKYSNVDTTQLEQLEEEYNFTYYNNLTTPDIVDYKAILESYGIDCSNLTDDEIKALIEQIKNNDN